MRILFYAAVLGWLALAAFGLALEARSADGDPSDYGGAPGYGVQKICEAITDIGNETSCTIQVMDGLLSGCTISYGKVPSACTPPNPITCSVSHQATAGAPNVWTDVGTLTDPVVGTSTIYLTDRPLSFVRCNFAASVDVDCVQGVDATEIVLGCSRAPVH